MLGKWDTLFESVVTECSLRLLLAMDLPLWLAGFCYVLGIELIVAMLEWATNAQLED